MARKYPRIGARRRKKIQGQCAICKENKADMWIYVQVNWFRGDDDCYKVHKSCVSGVRDNELLSLLGYKEAG